MIATPLHWIEGPWLGRLAIAPRPRGGDWLTDEMRAWHNAGVDVVVSALTVEEEQELDLGAEADDCRAEGMTFVSFPIPDRGTPDSRSVAETELRRWERELAEGHSIAIHCRQGVGRSALLAASLLAIAGLPTEDAWRRIRTARRAPVPDTREQEAWVEELMSDKVMLPG